MISSLPNRTINLNRDAVASQSACLPTWFQQGQAQAWEQFLTLPSPTRSDEMWRFANLKQNSLESFVLAPEVMHGDEIVSRSQGIGDVAAKLIFANNRLIHQDVVSLPKGVILLSLEEALKNHEELFHEYFMRYASRLGSLKFSMLSHAQLRTGAFLYLPPGVILQKPIEIWHWVEGAHSAIFPHTLLVAGKNSQASVLERFSSLREEPNFACSMNDLIVEEEACLNYACVQEWSAQTTAFHLSNTSVSTQGRATALQLHFGGRFIRTESDSRLLGRGAKSIMLSMNLAHDKQEIDQRTYQDHIAPEATSDLLYHNALNHEARTIFAGLIKVEKDAHQTDAYQKVRNLMLNDEAEANSMPGLEILADDVRCTHGATSGELNQEELFYMMARGIPPQEAAKLIVRGFFQIVLDRFEEPLLRKYLGELLDVLVTHEN